MKYYGKKIALDYSTSYFEFVIVHCFTGPSKIATAFTKIEQNTTYKSYASISNASASTTEVGIEGQTDSEDTTFLTSNEHCNDFIKQNLHFNKW